LKVAVIDDDESVRAGLRAQLEALGHAAELFASVESFRADADPAAFDCILLDIWFKHGASGLELLRHFQQARIDTPVVVITAEPDHETAFDAASLGVKAYLPKPVRRTPLVESLRKATESRPAKTLSLAQVNGLSQQEWEGLLQDAAQSLEPALLRRLKELTPTEAKVFRLLASEGPSNKEMARRLDKGEKVIEAHRASVIRKLETGNLIQLHSILARLIQAAA